MRETICFRVFHFYKIDIKSSRYAFKEFATLFIELIEHHIISSFCRKRKPVLPKPPRGKVSRNALLINGEGNGARQRAVMTLWERERERDGACATSGPTIWMQKESSQNLIFFIVFCNGTDVHNQDPLPWEYRDSDSPILHTFRGISPHPREGGETKFAEPFLRLRGSYGFSRSHADFHGSGLHARENVARTPIRIRGGKREKEKEKENPCQATRNYTWRLSKRERAIGRGMEIVQRNVNGDYGPCVWYTLWLGLFLVRVDNIGGVLIEGYIKLQNVNETILQEKEF